MAKTSHSQVSFGTNNYSDSLNGKAQHTHIPRIYGRQDITFNNTMVDGGGCLECAICGQVLYDCQT